MVNAFKKGRKLLKKLADKAAGTRLGKQVMKIPAPIRKGYAAGLMVPIPGAGEVGALAGTGVWAKGAIEDRVASPPAGLTGCSRPRHGGSSVILA
jgi:hypothetical protein